MEHSDIIRKIKKLMAVAADPSASDQEIQLAAYRANRLRVQYKIQDKELVTRTHTVEDVNSATLANKGCGYIHFVLKVLANSFQCETTYTGKLNRNDAEFHIVGLKGDVDLCIPVAEGMIYYLNEVLNDLKASYIGDDDFRVFKRDYCRGFAFGLKQQLEQGLIEMQLDSKYEVAVVGVPAVVSEWVDKKVIHKKARYQKETAEAYKLGERHGREYDLSRHDLITNG